MNGCESHANPNTPLWGTGGNVVALPIWVSSEGGTNTYDITGGGDATLYSGLYQTISTAGMYLLSISIDINLRGTGTSSGSQNLSLVLVLSCNNTNGTYVCGNQYYFDATQQNSQASQVMLTLPFTSIGDNSEDFEIIGSGYYDFDTASWEISTYSAVLQLCTLTPTTPQTIFG